MSSIWHGNDEMWETCAALLPELSAIGDKEVLIAGGYGLFLKQNWLIRNSDIPSLVPIRDWRDNTPRSTKDIDLAIGLDLIADESKHKEVVAILERNGFEVEPNHKNWGWIKKLPGDRSVLVEMHAPRPEAGAEGLVSNGRRVKRKPSLSNEGFHGNQNDELAGYDLHPCRFEHDQVTLAIPNPVTFLVMKITAAQDQWEKWENPKQDPRYGKTENREKAIKHAEDVFRVVAMVTREEADQSEEILAAVRSSDAYAKAANFAAASFTKPGVWGADSARGHWDPADFDRMLQILRDWFA